jgi:2-furoyl-CoA dehydrogenase large subunit
MAKIGDSVRRVEDRALLLGRGRYADDLAVPPRTLEAHLLRSPHAHAAIRRVDASRALAMPGVHAVITGEDVRRLTDPFLVAVKARIPQWSLAVERVRYVGEPVALVVAANRYVAEDAADRVEIEYAPLPAVIDARAAVAKDAPLVHEAAGTNEVSTRRFVYGDPESAFAAAARRVAISVSYPRNSFTPIECFVVVAEHRPDGGYDATANFQGPFSVHPVMARALRIPGSALRLKTPADSGGSFGVKLAVFPYIVLMCVASRLVRRPVKWVEDRLEHLQAASTGPARHTRAEAAVAADGRILALRFDNIEDYGAYLRAPMPGPLYRMHGAVTGAYDVANVEVVNRVALTNTMPAGLIRGFGGPQHYLALERLMQKIARELGLDPLAVIKHNLVRRFPYRAAAGALYDSGDYARAIEEATGARLAELKTRRDAARAAGRRYGIGFAAVVEPALSNMGYLSTLLTAEARERAGAKSGALALATVAIDPLGAVSVTGDAPVEGQGHATVLAQIVADTLGLEIEDIAVNLEIDTAKDAWSIATGTYSSRFSPGTAVAARNAAETLRARLAAIAAKQLNVLPADIEFAERKVRSRANPDNALPFARVAGTAHWSPSLLPDGIPPSLRETGLWSPPELAPPAPDDRINTSLTYGFVFDMCGIEIDAETGRPRIDRYVSMHDAGRLLNPMLADGQVRGAFAQGLGAALFEEFLYDGEGAFLTGTLADYLVPTACEVPHVEILHIHSPSPLTPLGAKGLAEGNCMSVPACVANAIADALGIEDVGLPATPLCLLEAMRR